ncbi:MAG: hypothetical protein U9R15_02970 [Chloroflexota bacterium]|nr:hypothetical protein [Chloroflexota bacterium]
MEQHYGMTVEMYQVVTALVDDRIKASQVTKWDYDRLERGQGQLEGRMDRVEAALERLTQAQARTEKRVEELAQAQARTEERLDDLIQVVGGIQDTLGAVKGRQLELVYKERVGSYFGPLLRRVCVASHTEIEDDLEAHLSAEEFRDLLRIDLLVRGQPRHVPDAPQVWLAVEVSGVIDRHDVERAQDRAGYMRKAGYIALPTVTGEDITQGAKKMVQEDGVLLVMNGWTSSWEQALEQALAEA